MTRFSKALVGLTLAATILLTSYVLYTRYVGNPRVIAELRSDHGGSRAARVMLIGLPDGRELPVNYLREGGTVYVGVDGLWWRLLEGEARPVTVLIKGQTFSGQARAILDDTAYTEAVFARLRPTAPTWLPGRLGGVLVEINLDTEH